MEEYCALDLEIAECQHFNSAGILHLTNVQIPFIVTTKPTNIFFV